MRPPPTSTAIHSLLPPHRKHFLLRLMPYNASAGDEYGAIQDWVIQCLQKNERSEVVLAVSELKRQVTYGLDLSMSPSQLLDEVCEYVLDRTFSFIVLETQVHARLRMADVVVKDIKRSRDGTSYPALIAGDGSPAKPEQVYAAMQLLDEIFPRINRILRGTRWPVEERLAGIRLTRLQALYGLFSSDARTLMKGVWWSRLRFIKEEVSGIGAALFSDEALLIPLEVGEYDLQTFWRQLAIEAKRRWDESIADAAQEERKMEEPESPALPEPTIAPVLEPAPLCATTAETPTAPEPAQLEHPATHVFVSGSIPPARDRGDNDLLRRYAVLNKPMPLAPMPSQAELDESKTRLMNEFPWGHDTLQALFEELSGRRTFGAPYVHIRPVLLHGPSGCGKTRLAQRIAEEVGASFLRLSCGGTTDAMAVTGTNRGWSSGQPSPLLLPLLEGSASVLYCLDEIDKAADLTRNSPPLEAALLSLLEPTEARSWRDPFLQVACDLTPLMFVFTANHTHHLSAAFRSRVRTFKLPSPTPSQMWQTLPYVMRDIEREWQLPEGALEGMPTPRHAFKGIREMRMFRRLVISLANLWIKDINTSLKH